MGICLGCTTMAILSFAILEATAGFNFITPSLFPRTYSYEWEKAGWISELAEHVEISCSHSGRHGV